MALKVRWTKRADQKFANIIDYLNYEWGENSARSFAKTVINLLELLKEFPEIGGMENAEKNIRGFVIVKQLTLFYRVKKNEIIILNFFDNRQHPAKKTSHLK